MQTFEQQQIVQLERRLATLASEFRACETDDQRREVAQRYEKVFCQLKQSDSWCGEPYLDSQLPDSWMPKSNPPPAKNSASAASRVLSDRRYTTLVTFWNSINVKSQDNTDALLVRLLLMRGLDRLTSTEHVIANHLVHGLSFEEIATALEMSKAEVQHLTLLALTRMQRELADELGTEPTGRYLERMLH